MKEKLIKNLSKSYSPYSNVKVSAILKTKDGKEFTGVNIENASYTPTICAERNAIFKAVSEGYKKGDFSEINLTSSLNHFLYPCGVCRQVMTEFFDDQTKIIVWHEDKKEEYTINDLIPYSVTKKDIR